MTTDHRLAVRALDRLIDTAIAALVDPELDPAGSGPEIDPAEAADLDRAIHDHERAADDLLTGSADGGEYRRALIDFLTDLAGELLHQRDQFLDLSPEVNAALGEWAEETVNNLAAAIGESDPGPTGVMSERLAGLSRVLQAVAEAAGGGSGLPIVGADYAPATQLAVLGLEVESMASPVLDLGCGAEGRLVEHLRALGLEAVGCDRYARPLPHLTRGDWFEFPRRESGWGTIISHQAVSLHFLHHHLKPGDGHLRYALLYRSLLESLAPGGTLAYAPGLPFIESALPEERFRVTRIDLPSQLRPRLDFDPGPGFQAWLESVGYAARVERLG